ncbi:MAG TPA: nodulation protein NfeD, partial [Candidatus Dormibacteraeota bacterium]|nr:nodulation protein NfeD [Candidatus Dormibacteraeota bacterium]
MLALTLVRPFRRRPLLALVWLGLLLLAIAAPARAGGGAIAVLPTTGDVDNVMADYIKGALDKAARDGDRLAIVELNTLGGSLDSTGRIVSSLLDPPLPVVVWVGPAGAKAASAGTFITLAANLAYMADGTNIGAAAPVDSSGQDIGGTLGEKVRNDAIASITSIAERRGHDVATAVSTVQDAKSYPASQAVSLHLVNGLAPDLEAVRAAADGQEVQVGGRAVKLDLGGAPLEELPMNPFQGFLHLLSDPNIAFILFTIGFYGLLFELASPNFVTGILGALAIILAFVGFGSLPVNVAGLLLVGLGVILFALEPHIVSHGALTLGGLACLVLGAFALYDEPGIPGSQAVGVALPVIVVVAADVSAFALIITVTA